MTTRSKKKVLVCTNFRSNPNTPSCGARGSEDVLAALANEGLEIAVEKSPCLGFCNIGPNVRLAPKGVCFHTVSPKNMAKLIKDIKSFIAC